MGFVFVLQYSPSLSQYCGISGYGSSNNETLAGYDTVPSMTPSTQFHRSDPTSRKQKSHTGGLTGTTGTEGTGGSTGKQ